MRIGARRIPSISDLVVAALGGCGGSKSAADAASAEGGAAPDRSAEGPVTAATAAGAATGRTVEVRMIGDAQGYRFEPADVTVHPGDAVRWVSVSGGPHNVTFWADSVPPGAAAYLAAHMPNTTGALTGPLLSDANAAYVVSFAGARPGVYGYYCTPHLTLGMKARVTVR